MLCDVVSQTHHILSSDVTLNIILTPGHRHSGGLVLITAAAVDGEISNFTHLKLIQTGQHESYLSFANLRPNLNIYSDCADSSVCNDQSRCPTSKEVIVFMASV